MYDMGLVLYWSDADKAAEWLTKACKGTVNNVRYWLTLLCLYVTMWQHTHQAAYALKAFVIIQQNKILLYSKVRSFKQEA